MLYEIGKDLGVALRAKGCPMRVEYRPRLERTAPTTVGIELAPDEQDGTVGPPRAVGGNPPRRFTWNVPAVLRIFARSTAAGARASDHDREAGRAVEAVLVCLDDVLRGGRRLLWRVRGIRPETVSDEQGSEQPVGAVVLVRFEVERAVFARKWDGSPALEANPLAGVASSTRVSIAGAGGGTACGE